MDVYESQDYYSSIEEFDGVLTVGSVDDGVYGNNYGDLTDDDAILAFQFENGGRGIIIDFDTYDIDISGEILVFVNGLFVGLADAGGNDEHSSAHVTVGADYVIDGTNELVFVNVMGPDQTWGIENINIQAEPALFFNEFEDGIYGNMFEGTIDTDGVVSFQFFYQSEEDLTLYVQGYDIDYYGEVEVFLNGVSMGYMNAGENNELSGSNFDIAAEDILADGNVISFEIQADHKRAWGVTDLILLNEGINISSMAIDPEFTDDGWVTWQETEFIYLGRYDTNSGALMEVVNQSVGGALPFYVTYYGSELVPTANGPVALGITDHGIIYLDEHDSYILEGTEGYRVGFLPKGSYDGLRFTMVDLDYWVYDGGTAEVFLYDNGEITLLDFGDPTTRAITWINESEVAIFSETQMGVYNVDTEEVVWITDDVYDEGYIAATETSSGEKFISILHDDGFTDVWTLTEDGWELWRRLVLPEEVFGEYLYSPEFVEQDGKTYLMGISSVLPTTTDQTAIVMYDFDDDTWSQVTDVQYAFDPEIVALEHGAFALYYRNSAEGLTEWVTVSAQEVLDAAVPGVHTPIGKVAETVAERLADYRAERAASIASITADFTLAPAAPVAVAAAAARAAEARTVSRTIEANVSLASALDAEVDVFDFASAEVSARPSRGDEADVLAVEFAPTGPAIERALGRR